MSKPGVISVWRRAAHMRGILALASLALLASCAPAFIDHMLAHSPILKLVVEGVDTESQANLLRLLKCD